MLDDEVSNILENLDVNLTNLELICRFCKKPHDFEKERELRLLGKKKKNEIERLEEEVKNNRDELLDHLLDNEDKFSKLLTDLKYEKHDTSCIIHVLIIYYYTFIYVSLECMNIMDLIMHC